MSERERKVMEEFAKRFYYIVKEYINYDEWLRICREFAKYRDSTYLYIPFNLCEVIYVCNKIGFKDDLIGGTQIILLTSIIETLTRRVPYKTFQDWFSENKDYYANKNCLQAFNDYNAIHGARKNFRSFFLNYLSIDEKIELLLKIRKIWNNEILAPFCFQTRDECYYSIRSWEKERGEIVEYFHGYSNQCKGKNKINECPAMNNEKIMNNGIKELADCLYEFRSKFVHESIIPTFSFPFFYENERPLTERRIKIGDKEYRFIIELNTEDLFVLIMNKISILLDDFLSEVS